ncbi:hypothetical protein [Actinomadura parmotrematis]|uniref:Uncharacterized protein n=1 Tax=Actinomadura parmotrematis TaxID=2864039 RepID=A0ABS7G3K0_9ACTN|nr:hypothetical protein [Actinomadura parmotrematis]MBW8487295.1 hypothetical protein [Actinomadura parmotrematis]
MDMIKMAEFADKVRDHQQDAHEARAEAELRLENHMREGDTTPELMDAIASMAHLRAAAAWWDQVVDMIDRQLPHPADAVAVLRKARRDAHRASARLTSAQPGRHSAFMTGFMEAALEGAGTFKIDAGRLLDTWDAPRAIGGAHGSGGAGGGAETGTGTPG